MLAPAERVEILVDLSDAPTTLRLLSLPFSDPMDPITNLTQVLLFGANDENTGFEILELRPQAAAVTATPAVPAMLNVIARMAEADALVEREFVLDQEADGINGLKHDHNRIDQVIKRGDTEIWTVRNFSSTYHPFHVHGVQFQVLDRNGVAPPAWELGWKDTVVVQPTESVRIILRFDSYADPHAPFMFHCHILEHEDMGMMGQFVVVDDLEAEVGIAHVSGQIGHVH
jgi:FtsP/CotA-like multicopper oxidase with cupredoxin domain